jgi:hypothetical protein
MGFLDSGDQESSPGELDRLTASKTVRPVIRRARGRPSGRTGFSRRVFVTLIEIVVADEVVRCKRSKNKDLRLSSSCQRSPREVWYR